MVLDEKAAALDHRLDAAVPRVMNRTDLAVIMLERKFPQWQVWVVNRYIGPLWCARRRDEAGRRLYGNSADELEQYLTGAQL
jgi:hypothetical protein